MQSKKQRHSHCLRLGNECLILDGCATSNLLWISHKQWLVYIEIPKCGSSILNRRFEIPQMIEFGSWNSTPADGFASYPEFHSSDTHCKAGVGSVRSGGPLPQEFSRRIMRVKSSLFPRFTASLNPLTASIASAFCTRHRGTIDGSVCLEIP